MYVHIWSVCFIDIELSFCPHRVLFLLCVKCVIRVMDGVSEKRTKVLRSRPYVTIREKAVKKAVRKETKRIAAMDERPDILEIDADSDLEVQQRGTNSPIKGRTAKSIGSIDLENNASLPSIVAANIEMMKMLKEIRSSHSTKEDLLEYGQVINKQFVVVENKISTNASSIQLVEARVKAIEQSMEDNRHEAELTKQNLLSNNLTIIGIPETPNENLRAVAIQLFSLVDCQVTNGDIFGCYRIRKGRTPTDIVIVKINDVELKLKIMRKKAAKQVKLNEILPNAANGHSLIYVNNHVTPYFGKLLAEGRRMVKEFRFHSVRLTKNGCQIRFQDGGEDKVYRDIKELRGLATLFNKKSMNQHKRSRSSDDEALLNTSRAKK